MSKVRNILFIMCDQLRADHLSCYGHKTLATPHIDALAARGTRFDRAYVQAPVCGPSRMSYYTGRYTLSHGATWNFVPLPVGERTLGDYLRPAGLRVAVVGKTHHEADVEGMKWLGLCPNEGIGKLVAAGGFEDCGRDDGIHPDHRTPPDLPYNQYLRANGFDGANPWHEWANSGIDENGEVASGWLLRNSRRATRLPEQFSETAYTTDRAMSFITGQGDKPWCLHLSYIKPHWPYIAPAPYNDMYGPEDCQVPIRSEAERSGEANPIFRGFQEHSESVSFSKDEVRATVLPAYMGLIKQVDDHIGRLTAFLEKAGRLEDTLIVFSADHGDYMGDHWQGEKEFMYEQGVRVPFIIADPSDGAVRGAVCNELVEAIDLVPTFLDALGQTISAHILEGHSLLPLLRGSTASVRDAAFSELDYAIYPTARKLGLKTREARMVMACGKRFKLVHFGRDFAPQLFDLVNDPHELTDLGRDTGALYAKAREELYQQMFEWMRARRNRIGMSDEAADRRPSPAAAGGVKIGVW